MKIFDRTVKVWSRFTTLSATTIRECMVAYSPIDAPYLQYMTTVPIPHSARWEAPYISLYRDGSA